MIGDTMISSSSSYLDLQRHQLALKSTHLTDLFATDNNRAKKLRFTHDGLLVDFSKNLLDDKAMDLLLQLAETRQLAAKRDAMFGGEHINSTEDRAVLHVALRNPAKSHVTVDGHDVMPEVHEALAKMTAFAEQVRSGDYVGYTGKKIKTIIHIGIGGSEIGPHMAYDALTSPDQDGVKVHFVSNVDPVNISAALGMSDPEETLVIVVSKSFTTIETLTNASAARDWLIEGLGAKSAVEKHFIAIASDIKKATAFGVSDDNIFPMWDWVGGRYSLMSSAGLSLMIAIGPSKWQELLHGAHNIDEHFRKAPPSENIPLLMGLISFWYTQFWGVQSELALPYAHRLSRLSTYLQQASMESNGKSVTTGGVKAPYPTGAVVWGGSGTDTQHTFMQLLHQGSHLIPADFIGFKKSNNNLGTQQELLLANMLAQSEALAFGVSEAELKKDSVEPSLIPHKTMPGNRPSTTLLFPQLTPYALGQLIALYEHKIFTVGALLDVNSFDQYGVQLGKVLSDVIFAELTDASKSDSKHDQSTQMLIDDVRR